MKCGFSGRLTTQMWTTRRCNGYNPNWSIANISGSSANRIKELIQHGVLHRSYPIISLRSISVVRSFFTAQVRGKQTLTHTSICTCLPFEEFAVVSRFDIGFHPWLYESTQLRTFVDSIWFGWIFWKGTCKWILWWRFGNQGNRFWILKLW